mgnify:CR=1 FL=1|jgi:hypothetical protein
MKEGYLIVASKRDNFYSMAIQLAESIKDFDEDANICIVTEKRFEDHRLREVATDVIYCDDHYRAKLWGMAQTPYDKTFYIDADCLVVHEDIKTIFDQLGDDDMKFTYLGDDRKYVFREIYFPAGKLELCGGVCLYNSTPLIKEFMNDWWELFVKQWANSWWPLDEKGNWNEKQYPRSLKYWDQFSLWWLVNKVDKYKDLNIGIFEDDARWNWYTCYNENKTFTKNPIVIEHYSNMANKDGVFGVEGGGVKEG